MIFYVTNYVTKPWQTSVIFHGHHLLLYYYIVVGLHSVVAVSKCTYLLALARFSRVLHFGHDLEK